MCVKQLNRQINVSIHAPNEGSDNDPEIGSIVLDVFQSTPSMKRATTRHTAATRTLWPFQSTPSMKRATW